MPARRKASTKKGEPAPKRSRKSSATPSPKGSPKAAPKSPVRGTGKASARGSAKKSQARSSAEKHKAAGGLEGQRVALKNYAVGDPTTDCFELVPHTAAAPEEGQVTVRVRYLSLDPYMRGRIGNIASQSSRQAVAPLGSTIPGATVGEVVASRAKGIKVGDFVHSYSGWVSVYTAAASDVEVVRARELDLPLEKFLGVMGMTGLTSFYGLTFVGEAKKGETVVVSGAAGAVGSVVVQIAKIYGCRVVAIASKKKQEYLKSIGADACVAYDQPPAALERALKKALPHGVDVYFDNTGGVTTDLIIPLINKKARIAICGQISTYNADPAQSMGPRLLHHLLWKSAKIQGFLVQDWIEKDAETHAQLARWIKSGQLVSKEHVVKGGLAAAPAAFLSLFNGGNDGKLVVNVADD